MPSESSEGLMVDPLFVGATRPPMRWGVTYSALLFNMVFTLEAFLLTKNLLDSGTSGHMLMDGRLFQNTRAETKINPGNHTVDVTLYFNK